MTRRLCVVQLLPRMGSGGAESSALEIALALVAAGHRSIVIAAEGSRVDTLRATGSEFRALDLASKTPMALWRARALRRWLLEIRPDIVHLRSRLPAWIAHLALRGIAPAPLRVSTLHGLNSVSRYSAIMTRADAVIAVSACARDYWQGHYPDLDSARITVIPRGIDNDRFHPAVQPTEDWYARLWQQHPALKQRRLLCLPGRGTRLKGHRDALDLLAALHGQGVDAALWMPGCVQAGRERYLREIEQYAHQLGIADRLVMSPTRDDMPEVMAASDLVLQLSRSPESFGRTVIEALAVGTLVLGWDHGGVGEILAKHFPQGRIALGDSSSLTRQALQLLASSQVMPDMRSYRLQTMQQATLDLYLELIEQRDHAGR